MSGLLIRVDGGPWTEPTGSGYAREADLQQLLAEHPGLIPGVSADAVVCREFQSGVGQADIVAVDPEGALTLVECKLAANPQVRREVIGQVLDYASRLWRMPVLDFESKWTNRTGESPFSALGDDDGQIRETVAENLLAGRVRIVLAVDAINEDLRRIVEYLNAITLPSTGILAVEFRRVHEGSVEILTPRSYGEELVESKETGDAGKRHRWSVDEYREWATLHDPEALPALDSLLSALEAHGFGVHGGRAANPSLNASIDVPGIGMKWPMCMFAYRDAGAVVQVRIKDFKRTTETADRYAEAVAAHPAISVDLQDIRDSGYRRMPVIPLSTLTQTDAATLIDSIADALRIPRQRPEG